MFLKRHLNLIIVSLLALIFFLTTSCFNYLTQEKGYVKWSSPDETANYFFTQQLSETGQLAFFDKANVIGDNMAIPRSVRSDAGSVKPVSFLGIILIYGYLASIFGTAIIPFLTPLFAALGLIIFYLIVRRFFAERVALWSAFILASFPVYVYYTVRSMFHNILFLVLLLVAVYFCLLVFERKKEVIEKKFIFSSLGRINYLEFILTLAAGLFAGLAIITRTSELLWLLPVGLVIALIYYRKINFFSLIVFLSGLFLALLPVAYYNQILYGSFWHGGYNEMNRSLEDIAANSSQIFKMTWSGQLNYFRNYLSVIFHNIFYFGFNSEQSILMAKHYILEMFPLLSGVGFLGLILLLSKNVRHFKKKYLTYFLAWTISSILLIFYYGSWKFNDNPDLSRFTIGNSYTRYWLPIYLGLIPLAAFAMVEVSRALAALAPKTELVLKRIATNSAQLLSVFVFIFFSFSFVLYGSEEGLIYLYYNSVAEKEIATEVWSLTEPDAVIITRYYDKYFWPERRVIMGMLPNDEISRAVQKLIKQYPVYYYNFYLNETAVAYLNERKLGSYDLEIKLLKKMNDKFGLYKITSKPNGEKIK